VWGGMRGGLGIGGGVTSPPSQNSPYGGQMSQNLHWNTQFLSFYKNHYIIAVLDSERAGSRTLEKFSRRDRDRDCAKFESSRRFRGLNMNPKKKSRRYRASVSIQALDLAISRFTNSLVVKPNHITFHTILPKCTIPINGPLSQPESHQRTRETL
jgi:hypothetical protein